MPWELGPGLPVMNMKNMPAEPLVFQSGTNSAGLELVDIYLWTFKRFMEDKALTKPLSRLVYTNLKQPGPTACQSSRLPVDLRNSW